MEDAGAGAAAPGMAMPGAPMPGAPMGGADARAAATSWLHASGLRVVVFPSRQ